MGFQTAARPRPIFNERPRMPVVPIERVRYSTKPSLAEQMNRAQRIKSEVALRHDVTVAEIDGIDRNKKVADARREAYRALREAFPGWSVSQIARAMGKTFNAADTALKRLGLK